MKPWVSLFALAATTVIAWAQPQRLLSSGPMIAWSEMTEVALWVQTTSPAKVTIRYRPQSGGDWQSVSQTTTEQGDHIALLKPQRLAFGTTYDYELWLNDQKVDRGFAMQFKSQPHWRWRTEPPTIKFGLGSCSYFNHPEFDRPGTPYGGDYEIYQGLINQKLDFMLWLGDNDYYREPDWTTERGLRDRWRYQRQTYSQLAPFWANTAHYALWDDHDYGPNDSDRTYRLRNEALKVFNDYWPSPVRGTLETPGNFFRFEWGDVEFFMMDDRFHRAPNRWPAGPDKVMFGRGQLDWLKGSLLDSDATFKIICNGNQMINPLTLFEAFGNFPTEQKELFDFIATNRIQGVMFLSGDRHATELLKVQWPGSAYPWYEFTSSPLNSGAGRSDREANNPARVSNTWVTGKRNFGTIEVTGKRNERVLTLRSFDKDNKELWKHVIQEAEIELPRTTPAGGGLLQSTTRE